MSIVGAPEKQSGQSKERKRGAGRPHKRVTHRISADILQAAEALFLERGYSGTTLDDVAAQAGIAKHTIYRRFKSKEDLFVSAVLSVFRKRYDRRPLPLPDEISDPETVLKSICRAEIDVVLDPKIIRLFRVAYNETQRFPEMTSLLRDSTMDDILTFVTPILHAAQKAGKCMEGDPDFLAKHLVLSVTGLPFTRALLGATDLDDAAARDRYFDQSWSIVRRMFEVARPA